MGVIADDLTGAVDVATGLTEQGMATVILTDPTGIDDAAVAGADACVVALKSRSAAPEDAVRWSLEAGRGLLAVGSPGLYLKYCSTFDSTAEGNIGPVADALLELTEQRVAVLVPGYPTQGRTVYQRHLFVGSELLSESSMRHHPLTPMLDSDLVALMSAQSRYPVTHVPLDRIRGGVLGEELRELATSPYCYAVLDTVDDADLDAIAAVCHDDALVTGGAGLASALARRHALPMTPVPWRAPSGAGGIIAGSCSAATRRQVAAFASAGPVFTVDPWRCLANADDVVQRALDWAADHASVTPFLVASCADAGSLQEVQREVGVQTSAAAVEGVLGRIAAGVVDAGTTRLLVAGGETSGAVIASLGVRRLDVRAVIEPGLAWCESDHGVALALKSGNFGSDDVFLEAHRMLTDAAA